MASSWVERALRPRSEIRSCSTYNFGLGFRVYNLLDNGSFRYYSYRASGGILSVVDTQTPMINPEGPSTQIVGF